MSASPSAMQAKKSTGDSSTAPAKSRFAPPKLDGFQWALLLLIFVYIFVFARLAFDLHAGMRTHKADLGQIDQAIWNSSQGRFLQQTDGGTISTRMTDHVEPMLVMISPVFWLWNDVRAILLLQVVFVAIGAWLLYHLALHRLDRALSPAERTQIWQREPLRQWTRPISFALGVAWLLAAPLQSAVLTEFHAAPLAAPLILWALWALERLRWGRYAVAVILLALVKEEMALVAFMLGLWGIWQGWRARKLTTGLLWGGGLALLSLAWFAVATFVIVPHYAGPFYGSQQSTYFARYGALGNSPTDIVRALLTQPGLVWSILSEPARLAYLWRLLALFAFLGVLGPELLILSLPVLMANVLSAYPAQYYGEFHYTAPVVAFYGAAAAFGVARLWSVIFRHTKATSASFQHLPAASSGTMAAASFVTNASTAVRPVAGFLLVLWILFWAGWCYVQSGRAWLGGRYDATPISAHHRLLDEFVAQVPEGAALTATAAVHPHLSHRQHIYQFPDGFDVDVPATWALLDVTTNTDMAPGDLKARVDEMLAGEWGVVDAADGFLLLARGAPLKQIARDFYAFTYPSPESQESTLRIDDLARWRLTRIESTWRDWNPAAGEPELLVSTLDGDLLHSFGGLRPPSLVWRPAQEWQAGEDALVTTLPLYLPRAAVVEQQPANAQGRTFLYRGTDGMIRSASEIDLRQHDFAASVETLTKGALLHESATAHLPEGDLTLHGWVADRRMWNGDAIDLWLQVEGDVWRAGWQFFVHLERDGQVAAQQDGGPRLLVDGSPSDALASNGYFNDWRSVTIPAEADPAGKWLLTVGIYDPATGERVVFEDAREGIVFNDFDISPFVADQTCALNGATCASQPDLRLP